MPNHITNKLVISGDQETLDRFYKENVGEGENKKSELDFERSVPMPEDVDTNQVITDQASLLSMFLGGGWHGWRIKNWGTKWNAYEVQKVIKEPGKLIYEFDTAWNQPEGWIKAVSKIYDTLTFDNFWFDEDVPQSGRLSCKRGEEFRIERYHDQDTAKEFFQVHFPDMYEKIREEYIKDDPEYYSDWDWGENPHNSKKRKRGDCDDNCDTKEK